MSAPTEVDWSRLDKQKFMVVGAGLFSGLTTALFPLTVIKTQQMAVAGAPTGLSGARQTAVNIVRQDGVRGLYRGFGTVILGAIPGRLMYLTVLEYVKAGASTRLGSLPLGEAQAAGLANFTAGAVASFCTQSIVIPIDVVSQRQMVAGVSHASSGGAGTAAVALDGGGAGAGHRSGLAVVRHILAREGLAGLYRGFGLSVATFVPSSAIWWGAYGTYQKLIWRQLEGWQGLPAHSDGSSSGSTRTVRASSSSSSSSGSSSGGGGLASRSGSDAGSSSAAGSAQQWQVQGQQRESQLADRAAQAAASVSEAAPGQVLAVQTASALLAGCTSAVLINPLDVVKTRLQVSDSEGGARPTVRGTLARLLAQDGAAGLWRGVVPRIVSVSMWGTCMVSAYEFLKRICALPEPPDAR